MWPGGGTYIARTHTIELLADRTRIILMLDTQKKKCISSMKDTTCLGNGVNTKREKKNRATTELTLNKFKDYTSVLEL